MTPRTVVHYVDSDTFGGSEEAVLHVMAALDAARWRPVLFHHPSPGIVRLVEGAARLGVVTRVLPRPIEGQAWGPVRQLRRALHDERPAVFHAHLSWPLACKYGVLAAWLARVPAIVGTAQLYIDFYQVRGGARQQWLMTRAMDRVIAVSDEVRERYRRKLHVPASKLAVVRNGIPVSRSPKAPDPALRAELVRGRPEFVVLTPARFHEQKGHAYLLEAVAQVPDVTLVLAGDGELRPAMEQRASELGIMDRCLFLGHRSDVPDLLAAADLFVLPSLFEGLPLSVLEAMAAQRPVIATAIGGTNEAVVDGETGLLVPPRDSAGLAAAIRRMRTEPALARRLAGRARLHVEARFSADVTAQGVMQVYESLVGPGRQ
ncbi:MAG TPA: glycosyltransferase family 4 protein [Gemmatimonadales bacterium]|nr:glycosyltransferase family 4 protein [Gemmatimonadales bacterium]